MEEKINNKMKVKIKCLCLYCGKPLPGFVECNCDKKHKNKNLWNIKERKGIKGRPRLMERAQ